tara:strand:- start:115 stop:630 length:516 start_codon:yes stop_codon:yes gene_type:complete
MEGQMATRKVKLTGIAEWAKVFTQNRDMTGWDNTYVDCNGACTIDVILDDDNMSKLSASRSMKRGAPDAMGRGTKVKFVRKFDTGRDWDSGAPLVVWSDNKPYDYDTNGSIGNGSTVEVELSVYDTSRKTIVGTRLDKVTVIDHVEYIADTSADMTPPPLVEVKQDSEVLF